MRLTRRSGRRGRVGSLLEVGTGFHPDLLRPLTYRLAFEQTGGGVVPRAAHALFDPPFWLLQRPAWALVKW